jgi:peptidoglycan/xylan/chitin deacetylase (PgdA/CDA1 family)
MVSGLGCGGSVARTSDADVAGRDAWLDVGSTTGDNASTDVLSETQDADAPAGLDAERDVDVAAQLCIPGQSIACVGSGACQGGQVCNADGRAYGLCDCGPQGSAVVADAGVDRGGEVGQAAEQEPDAAAAGGSTGLDGQPDAGGVSGVDASTGIDSADDPGESDGDPGSDWVALVPQGDGTIITQFQPGHGWTASGTGGSSNLNDTSQQYVGTQCATITSDGLSNNKYLSKKEISPAIDMTGKMLKVAIRVTNTACLLSYFSLRVDLGTDSKNFFRFGLHSNQAQQYVTEGDWINIAIPWDTNPARYQVTGSPDRAKVTYLSITIQDNNSGTGVTVNGGQVSIVDEPAAYPYGVISFTADDSPVSQYDEMYPALAAYGWAGTVYTIADRIGTRDFMTLANLQTLQAAGWDVAAHAYAGAIHGATYTGSTPEDVAADMDQVIAWLKSNGFKGWRHMAYPSGQFRMPGGTADALSLARSHFWAARTTQQATMETYPPSDPLKIRAYELSKSVTLEQAESMVDRAVVAKEWLVLVTHKLVTTPSLLTDWTISDFQSLAAYIATQYPMVPVKTVAQVLGL